MKAINVFFTVELAWWFPLRWRNKLTFFSRTPFIGDGCVTMHEFTHQWNLDYHDDHHASEGMFHHLDITTDGCLKKDDLGMHHMAMDTDSEIHYPSPSPTQQQKSPPPSHRNKEDSIISYNVFYSLFLREIHDKIFPCYL